MKAVTARPSRLLFQLSKSLSRTTKTTTTTPIRSICDDRGIIRSDHPDIELKVANVTEHIVGNAARKFKDAIAIECAVTGERSSFRDLLERTDAFSSGFFNLGLRRGDVVAVAMSNGTLFPQVAFGLAQIGVTASLVNPMCTPYEIGRMLKMGGAKAVVTQPMMMPNIMQAVEEMGVPDFKVFVDGFEGSDPRVHPLSTIYNNNNNGSFSSSSSNNNNFDYHSTTAFLPFSSGTTGPPKGVRLSHHNITSALDVYTAHEDKNMFDGTNGVLSIIPNFHIFGLLQVTSVMMSVGAKVTTMPVYDFDLLLNTLLRVRPVGLTLVPPLAKRLAADPRVTKDHLSSLRMSFCGGSPICPSVIEAFKAKAPKDMNFYQGYGMTECPTIAKDAKCQPGSTGRLEANVRAKFVDVETGETLAEPGMKGELCIKAPHLMQGYHNNPAATSEILVDGWLHTGDIGHGDQGGNIFIVDRKKDLIKHKGFQVSPSELESVIIQLPGVADVCVVGVPDDAGGEVPRAFVVQNEGATLSEAEIHDEINAKLSSYKRLRGGVRFVGTLPMHASGKVLRRELRN